MRELELILQQHDLPQLLQPTFSLNNYTGEDLAFYSKAVASCITMIITSIIPEIMALLSADIFRDIVANIFISLRDSIMPDTYLTHKLLKTQPKRLLWLQADPYKTL